MKGLIHGARGSQRKEVDHVFFKLHGHGRFILRCTDMPHHHEYLVLVNQLLGRQNSLFGVITRVFNQQLDLAPMDATQFIDFFDGHLHAGARLLAVTRQRAGEVLDGANQNFVLDDALLGTDDTGAQSECSDGKGCFGLHCGVSLLFMFVKCFSGTWRQFGLRTFSPPACV